MFEQLLMTLGHKKQLYRKGIPLRLLVKWGQKRIVCKLLQHQRAVKSFSQLMAKRCFSRTDIAFNGYKVVLCFRLLIVFHLANCGLIVQHDYIGAILTVHVKFVNWFAKHRVFEFWRDFHHGYQYEATFVQIRVRNF